MGWGKDKTNQHSAMSFTFTKGVELAQLKPTGNSNYSDVSIAWTPTVTLVNEIKNNNSIAVFPNPTNGIVSLNFKNNIQSATVSVENESGVSVYENNLKKDFSGNLTIDLTSFATGLYFVKVITPDNKYFYKVLLTE